MVVFAKEICLVRRDPVDHLLHFFAVRPSVAKQFVVLRERVHVETSQSFAQTRFDELSFVFTE